MTATAARDPRWPRTVLRMSAGLAFAAIGVVLVASLAWPRSWDGSVLEHTSWALGRGLRPYRDVFDMNYPGAYLFYGTGQRLFGTSDRSFRIRDVIVLLVALVALYRLMRRFPWPTAPVALVLVTSQYLVVGGVGMALQRDWLVAVAVLLAVVALAGRRSRWHLVGAGAALGAAMTIKPTAALLIVVLPAAHALVDAAALARRRAGRAEVAELGRRELRRLGWIVLGATLVCGAALLWVVASGGWSDFVWINRHYLPRYGRLDGGGMETSSTGSSLVQAAWATVRRVELPTMVLGAVVVGLRRRPRPELRLLLVLSAVGAAGFATAVAAGKVWNYHHWTWLLAALCLLAVGTADLATGRWQPWTQVPRWCVAVAALALVVAYGCWLVRADATSLLLQHRIRFLAFLLSPLPIVALAVFDLAGGRRRLPHGSILTAAVLLVAGVLVVNALALMNLARPGQVVEVPWSEERIGEVLASRLRSGDRIQILGTVGGHEAALEAGALPATSFTYDFHFFHDEGSPETDALRARFIREWRAHPPELVIVSERSWSHRQSYDDLRSFPELTGELAAYHEIYRNEDAIVLQRLDG